MTVVWCPQAQTWLARPRQGGRACPQAGQRTVRPAQPLQVAQAGRLVGEPGEELVPVGRVVAPGDRVVRVARVQAVSLSRRPAARPAGPGPGEQADGPGAGGQVAHQLGQAPLASEPDAVLEVVEDVGGQQEAAGPGGQQPQQRRGAAPARLGPATRQKASQASARAKAAWNS